MSIFPNAQERTGSLKYASIYPIQPAVLLLPFSLALIAFSLSTRMAFLLFCRCFLASLLMLSIWARVFFFFFCCCFTCLDNAICGSPRHLTRPLPSLARIICISILHSTLVVLYVLFCAPPSVTHLRSFFVFYFVFRFLFFFPFDFRYKTGTFTLSSTLLFALVLFFFFFFSSSLPSSKLSLLLQPCLCCCRRVLTPYSFFSVFFFLYCKEYKTVKKKKTQKGKRLKSKICELSFYLLVFFFFC